MPELDLTADELTGALLRVSESEPICLLDSCGTGHPGSHLMIAGIGPVEMIEVSPDDAGETLRLLDEKLAGPYAAVFSLSYELGRKLQRTGLPQPTAEPDLFLALYDTLVVHDYSTGSTWVTGREDKAAEMAGRLVEARTADYGGSVPRPPHLADNVTRAEYLDTVGRIQERIRDGDTYQTNLTHQITAELDPALTPQHIFYRLRRDHPAPFAAFLTRADSTVVSASPERFFRLDPVSRRISTSPIKGTRPRGNTPVEDERLRRELVTSEKDRAENTMIVDLLRNDIGRICEFGSVTVEDLCLLEEHPTLFHLVSTVSGVVREGTRVSDVVRALFPCGSVTGAPKVSTMRIIDEMEPAPRGLSMGAIGCRIPAEAFGLSAVLDTSVAIRTMTIRGRTAVFNVGGGIVIDSEPAHEYAETMTKARALLAAIGA